MINQIIKTKGMSCPHCEKRIEKAIMSIRGVESVKADCNKQETRVAYDEKKVTEDQIEVTIRKEGYSC